MNEPELTPYTEGKLLKAFKLVGKLIKFAFYALIIGINGILLFRIFTMSDPTLMETLMVTDRTAAAYAEAGESLEITYQKQTALDEEGLFAQSNLRYLPAIDQLQVTARYNNSTIKAAALEFELFETPHRDDDIFDITLVKVVYPDEEEQAAADRDALASDVIGEDQGEAEPLPAKETRYFPSAVCPDQKTVYNYRRLVFDHLDLSDADACYLEFYYKGALDYNADPYSRLLVWLRGDDRPYELTKHDKKALENGTLVGEIIFYG